MTLSYELLILFLFRSLGLRQKRRIMFHEYYMYLTLSLSGNKWKAYTDVIVNNMVLRIYEVG